MVEVSPSVAQMHSLAAPPTCVWLPVLSPLQGGQASLKFVGLEYEGPAKICEVEGRPRSRNQWLDAVPKQETKEWRKLER